jgi:hypothetical protein
MIRVDFIFSYWIFLWYLLYIFKIIKYNPKFAIYCGIIENTIIILLMIYYKTDSKILIYFLIMFFILKIIPLYTLLDTKILKNDIFITILLFIIYLFWIFVNNKTIIDFNKQIIDMILYNKYTFPGISFMNNFKIY